MRRLTKGRTPKSRWYDGHCLLDKLKIYAARVACIAVAYIIGLAFYELTHTHGKTVEPEEMTCTRSGWGGDC